MNIFSDDKKQQVLDALFELATNTDKGNVPAIKLYLELASEQLPQDTLTLDKAIDVIREFSNVEESQSNTICRHPERSEGPHCCTKP
ncbi:MAG: hypothetical protein KDB65_09980 [Calditrichaeota bacterium]|nr:hypothetical protein [Calditrichota bacterium]MCB9369521.1 hypothetical protein [Calditrichota bacterium]